MKRQRYQDAAVVLGLLAAMAGGGVTTPAGVTVVLVLALGAWHCYVKSTAPTRPPTPNRHPRKHWNDL